MVVVRRLALVLCVAGCMPEFSHATPDAGPRGDAAAGVDAAAPGDGAAAGPDGAVPSGASLAVTFTTTANGGNYAPRNIVAAWVEGPSGTFVKTIGRWANRRRDHLVAWTAAAGAADADAVSGATRANHDGALRVTWDLRDRAGALVPDGTYTIRLELADRNSSTADQNHQATFTFEKGPAPSSQTVAGGGFLDVVIDFTAP